MSGPETAEAPNDDELPGEWTIHVRHTGGGVWCRKFQNRERGLEVIYDVEHTSEGVGIQRGTFDDDYFVFEQNVAKVGSPGSEEEALEKAMEVVKTIEDEGVERYE